MNVVDFMLESATAVLGAIAVGVFFSLLLIFNLFLICGWGSYAGLRVDGA